MFWQSILQREGIRQLLKICWYLKAHEEFVKQGGTADKFYSSLAVMHEDVFLLEAAMKLFNLSKRWCG